MKILFLGEESGRSAEYLREALISLNHTVTHIGSEEPFLLEHLDFDAIVISDYPSCSLSLKASDLIEDFVNKGGKFIMIGGWISFNGKGNSYHKHPLSRILSVSLMKSDDRINYHQGLFLSPSPMIRSEHDLNWDSPPIICGYNSAKQKINSQALVWMNPVSTNGQEIKFLEKKPLVISMKYGKGISIACLTDIAPHWCGGLIDWGEKRLKFKTVEVGNDFVNFINMLFSLS